MGDSYPKFTAAAVHAASAFLDREASTAKACELITVAAGNGARLVVFPEAFIPGYPFWIWTHTPSESIQFFYDFFTNSVEVPSPTTDELCGVAKKVGAYVAIGISERRGGTLYNSILFISDEGKVMGSHRKLQPTLVERTVWGKGDGSDLVVFDTALGRIGGLICWEHTMDLVRYAMAYMGEQIHIAVWPGISALTHDPNSRIFDSVTEAAAKHHALAAQTFVINVQSCIDPQTIARLGLENRPEMIRTGGGWTAVVGPNGQIIAGPHRDDEQIVYAEIDLSQIILTKYACDSTGHYARPDVVRLWIDRTPQPVAEVVDVKTDQCGEAREASDQVCPPTHQ